MQPVFSSNNLLALPIGILLLTGCAGVKVTPLTSDGKPAQGQAEGVRYYMPKPYLLVAELPPVVAKPTDTTTVQTNQPTDQQSNLQTTSQGTADSKAKKDDAKDKDKSDASTGQSSPSQAPVADTSFLAANDQYVMKLVYLPDLSLPMAISQSTGLFGTSQMQPVLQDGWMLTSLNAASDSKVAETLTAVASIAGAFMGGGGAKAAEKGTKAAAEVEFTVPVKNLDRVLRPGLYRFVYNEKGILERLEPVAFFGKGGIEK